MLTIKCLCMHKQQNPYSDKVTIFHMIVNNYVLLILYIVVHSMNCHDLRKNTYLNYYYVLTTIPIKVYDLHSPLFNLMSADLHDDAHIQ